MKQSLALLLSALALLSTVAGLAQASPSLQPQVSLREGRLAYERGDFKRAVTTLQPLLYPTIELESEESVVEAHRLLALSYFFLKKEPEAEQEVASILALRPMYELDPVVDPPMAVAFFQGVRKKQDDQLRELQRRQAEEDEQKRRLEEKRRLEARRKFERVYVERQVETRSRLVAMLPFGIGQFQNKNYKLGIFFAVTQFISAGLSFATWISIDRLFPTNEMTGVKVYQPNQTALAQGLLGTQLASASAFWGLYLAGMIEAQVRLKPRVVIDRELPQPQKPKASIYPVLGSGIGIGGTF